MAAAVPGRAPASGVGIGDTQVCVRGVLLRAHQGLAGLALHIGESRERAVFRPPFPAGRATARSATDALTSPSSSAARVPNPSWPEPTATVVAGSGSSAAALPPSSRSSLIIARQQGSSSIRRWARSRWASDAIPITHAHKQAALAARPLAAVERPELGEQRLAGPLGGAAVLAVGEPEALTDLGRVEPEVEPQLEQRPLGLVELVDEHVHAARLVGGQHGLVRLLARVGQPGEAGGAGIERLAPAGVGAVDALGGELVGGAEQVGAQALDLDAVAAALEHAGPGLVVQLAATVRVEVAVARREHGQHAALVIAVGLLVGAGIGQGRHATASIATDAAGSTDAAGGDARPS